MRGFMARDNERAVCVQRAIARHHGAATPRAQASRPERSGSGDPDGDVLDLVARGDVSAALRRLIQRYGDAVHRYCREALRDAALADDVHQQVFIEVFRDLPRFAGRAPVRIWLFAIARHRALDAIKARARAHAFFDKAPAADTP